jgi:peptide-methionine (S)-S-oxide reductase
MEKATLGAGCFWGVEDAFRHVAGVVSTRVGYAGGTVVNPTYREVCFGQTGHTEVVEVTFDPSLVSYDALLELFWSIHSPTIRQKPQYKSVIFYHTPEQHAAAEASCRRRHAAESSSSLMVTEILPVPPLYEAEAYHQQYYEKTGQRSCGR